MTKINRHSYILVTPMKNEESNIKKVIQSIINQTIRPKIWVITDDNSTDKSPEIIAKYRNIFPWIIYIKNPRLKKNYELGLHVSTIYRLGFRKAREVAKNNNINYNYIASLDADTILKRDYFERLMRKFDDNPKLDLASGHLISIINYQNKESKYNEKQVCGTARMWLRKCFEETGGYLKTCSADTVSDIKSVAKGYDIKRFKDINIYQLRETASKTGIWKGYRNLGERNYYIHITPKHAFLKTLYLISTLKPYRALAYFIGYFKKYLSKSPKLKDKDVEMFNKRYK